MKQVLLLLLFILPLSLFSAKAKYLDNHSCNECHEKIYEEFQSSSHSNSYFTNELHRKIADSVSKDEYECATCHMPMADNLKDLISGKAKPNRDNKTHSDGVSCFFCHTIAYVKKSHEFNINTKARQAEGYKPTIYGRLDNPDDNDKHSSTNNPIYGKKVCMGCHSHKRNENNVTIFRAMDDKQDSESCIECHMPEVEGGAEKMDKRARGRHASHKFLGIHDKEMREKSADINISSEADKLMVTLTNRMDHPLIIQPARVKYLDIKVFRGDKEIWKNYDKHPSEDTQGYFAFSFKGDGEQILIPATATEQDVINNLGARETKIFPYSVKGLKKGDRVEVSLYVKLAKDDCLKVINLNDSTLNEPILMKKYEIEL
ncbi:MAG: multiheme c-type cytochrome [Campylobacterota bacterium]|nr:multiheme c-type cytochrome [Campylobacterota bacterium]